MQRAAVLSLTGKREIDGMTSLKRKTQGQALKGCTQRGDTTAHISPAQEMQCASPLLVLGSNLWYLQPANLLEKATHENVPLLADNGCF